MDSFHHFAALGEAQLYCCVYVFDITCSAGAYLCCLYAAFLFVFQANLEFDTAGTNMHEQASDHQES